MSIVRRSLWSSANKIRRLLTVSAIATANVHKCFNGLEQFMLAPPEFRRDRLYDCYDNDDDYVQDIFVEKFTNTQPTVKREPSQVLSFPSERPHDTGVSSDIGSDTDSNSPIQDTATANAEWLTGTHDTAIDSQFGPIGSQFHQHISQHVGGPLPQHIADEPSYFYILTIYISYMILIAFGRIRDFFGKRLKADNYKNYKEQDGYAALNSDFDNFYFRRLKTRMNDCFSRPITGVPGRYITLLDRNSSDENQTFHLTGSETTTLNLSSYNYLGFAQSSGPCADDVHASISAYGISSASPRLDSGTSNLTVEVEREIAAFVGKEDAIVFSMGFSTNATSFPALMGPGCLIFSDELNHASIRVGARLSGAMIKSYKHNDVSDLERLLREAISQGQPRTHKPWRKIMVVCEGLFSMEGTIADLPGLCQLKKKYKFHLFVDEAHSIGALGPRGRGVCDYFNIDPSKVDILMGTFTKSFGANGGYVAANEEIIQKLRVTNAAMHYGESTAPPVLMQILSSLRQITSTAAGLVRLQRITFNSRYLRLGLKRMGFIVYGHDDSPVIPMMLYHPAKLPAFSREMLKRKISVVVVGYPATPLLTARVRFCVSAAHNKEDMDRVLSACDEIGDLLDLKFSTGIMGGIEVFSRDGDPHDLKATMHSGSTQKPAPPRWNLEAVLANGVSDAKGRLN